jgi:UDP-N-acetyl-D-glucosamine dehydrogenase
LPTRKDIDDSRESPDFEIIDLLLRLGARIGYDDPHIPQSPLMRRSVYRELLANLVKA